MPPDNELLFRDKEVVTITPYIRVNDAQTMWVLVGGQQANPAYRIYNFRHDRSHDHAKELLKGYKGVLHSDKYGAYEAVAKTEEIVRCPLLGSYKA